LHAEQHFSSVQNPVTGIVLDIAIIQSWYAYPQYWLPETTPGTLTYLITRYGTIQTVLTVGYQNTDIIGSLLEVSTNNPVSGATINITVQFNDSSVVSGVSVSGVVPANAAYGVFVLRINSECNCAGYTDVQLGNCVFVDNTTQQTTVRSDFNGRLIIPATQSVMNNSQSFAVTPGHTFTVTIAIGSITNSSGYVGVAFLNSAQSSEVSPRVEFPFQPTTVNYITTTAATGSYTATNNGMWPFAPSTLFSAYFAGDSTHRVSCSCNPINPQPYNSTGVPFYSAGSSLHWGLDFLLLFATSVGLLLNW